MLRILLLPIALIREIQDHPMTLTVTPHLLKDTDSATAAIRLASMKPNHRSASKDWVSK